MAKGWRASPGRVGQAARRAVRKRQGGRSGH